MDRSYDLVDQPFIPCIQSNSQRVELGLRDTLVRAHELREIRDDCPLVTIALYRLLLAILHHVFGPASVSEWETVWRNGRFPDGPLQEYLDRWRTRFDLCDGSHPFYQTPGLPADEAVSIWRLAMVQANNATLFDHRMEHEEPSVEPAEAARLLVMYQAFAVGGGVSKPFNLMHGPLVREKGFLSLVLGENLFETLWLNAVPPSLRRQFPAGDDDAPGWERDAARDPVRNGTAIDGYMDYLTWPSRRILLIPDENDPLRFSRMVLLQGLALPESPGPLEPLACYEQNKDGDWRARSFEEGRSLWRDSHVLLQATSNDRRPPAALAFLALLKESGIVPVGSVYRVAAIGMRSDRAKIAFWRHETLPLPVAYMGDDRLVSALGEAIAAAEAGADALYAAVRATAAIVCQGPAGRADRDRVKQMVEGLQADTRYWAQLEQPFRPFLVELPASQVETRLGQWRETVVRAARRSFNQIVDGLGDSPRVLRAVYSANPWGGAKTLNIKLSKIANRQDKENAHEPARAD